MKYSTVKTLGLLNRKIRWISLWAYEILPDDYVDKSHIPLKEQSLDKHRKITCSLLNIVKEQKTIV